MTVLYRLGHNERSLYPPTASVALTNAAEKKHTRTQRNTDRASLGSTELAEVLRGRW